MSREQKKLSIGDVQSLSHGQVVRQAFVPKSSSLCNKVQSVSQSVSQSPPLSLSLVETCPQFVPHTQRRESLPKCR